MMITNADMTVYHRVVMPDTRQDAYTRYPVYGVLWEEKRAVNVINSGLKGADAVKVYVRLDRMDGVVVKNGDTIIRGICDREITEDYRIAQLQRDYPSAVVTSVDKKDFGSPRLQHFEIGGR